ncbi:MAG: hypothetical protein KDA63_06465 [Planctomycetales bacterium]|nr:hypothetical protein [Planctomycetales bacterium]
MTQAAANTLNRLLLIEYRSLPMFVAETSPWRGPGAEKAAETIENITLDQREYTARLVQMIQQLGDRPEFGSYPIAFTDMQMLSVDYLLIELVQRQRRIVPAVEACVAALETGTAARALAEEILGSEKAHLEALEELVAPAAA